MQLMNARTEAVVASEVEVADNRESRRKGLLGRAQLDPAAALVLTPCFSVHTAFMRFPIDVVFVDRNGVVLKIVRHMGPWRIAAAWRAHTTIEFAAGALSGPREVSVGDRLYLGPAGVSAESMVASIA